MQTLEDLYSKRGNFTQEDVADLISLIGQKNPNYDPNESDFWEDSILQDYAKYIINYLYTYNDLAKNVKPDTDLEEKHIGPMAQDIEKVAPDCIQETEDGIKTVDGNRLALVNAGAIADLARKLEEMQAQFKQLKGEE